MSWSLSASGHCADVDAEAALAGKLREVLTAEGAGASSAVIYTSNHGTINLLEPIADESAAAEEAPQADESLPPSVEVPLAEAGTEADPF
jgi:hypothetical protein